MMEIKLTGWEQVGKMLQGMPDKLQNRALKPSIRKGANIVKEAARVAAPIRETPYPKERIAGFSIKAWNAIARAGSIDTKYLPKGKHRKGNKKYWEFRSPGTLRRAITVGEAPRRARSIAKQLGRNGVCLAVGVAKRGYYGIFYESPKGFIDRGGKHHPGKPFLSRALDLYTDAIILTIKTAVSLKIKEIQEGG